MQLTAEQQDVLRGGSGVSLERQLRLLVRLGEIYGAARLIPVGSVQVSGVSYKSIGDPGLEFLEDLAGSGVKVRVPTWLNPAGMDLQRWRELGVPEDFARRQLRIMSAMEAMGIAPTATCTPYLAGLLPHYREHIAWSESSAVSFANSVLGARTNREGGPSALAAALLGITPEYGLHLDEKRKPTVRLVVRCPLRSNADFGVLGFWAGQQVKDGIPLIEGIERASTDDLKALGAAMAATGAVALYHAREHTPEADRFDGDGLPVLEYQDRQRSETLRALGCGKRPDIVVLGCPHASIQEIAYVASRLAGRRLNRPLWVCTSRVMKQLADGLGHTRAIEDAGGRVVADTCMVVSPMEAMGFSVSGVSSGKAANYLPGFCSQEVVFGDVDALIEEALS